VPTEGSVTCDCRIDSNGTVCIFFLTLQIHIAEVCYEHVLYKSLVGHVYFGRLVDFIWLQNANLDRLVDNILKSNAYLSFLGVVKD